MGLKSKLKISHTATASSEIKQNAKRNTEKNIWMCWLFDSSSSSAIFLKMFFMFVFQLFCLCSHLKVTVALKEAPEVCSFASNKGVYTKEVTVLALSTHSVAFIIVPLKVQSIEIEVSAFSNDKNDGIRKTLKVVVCTLHLAYIYLILGKLWHFLYWWTISSNSI